MMFEDFKDWEAVLTLWTGRLKKIRKYSSINPDEHHWKASPKSNSLSNHQCDSTIKKRFQKKKERKEHTKSNGSMAIFIEIVFTLFLPFLKGRLNWDNISQHFYCKTLKWNLYAAPHTVRVKKNGKCEMKMIKHKP